MTYVSRTLLDEYIRDKCFTSIAGLLRSAYIEGKGEKFLADIKAAIVRYAERGEAQQVAVWKAFIDQTVPLIKKDADECVAMERRFKETGSKTPPKPVSRKRR